ncbi:MAG: hypothetical protein JSU67_01185 [Gammaproteobacteria bacterium]|nr:MAG: hypothetical protein JSU67_01185 [Gammaproteobacteria bacterium]
MIKSNSSTGERLTIDSEPFARGKERACFLHPLDPGKIIKISTGSEDTQSRREITFFEDLQKRGVSDFRHLPRYFGTVETNLGRGLVLELICDANGEISRSLQWYLENGIEISQAESLLGELKQYLLDNLIIFNHDLFSGNLLLQKKAGDSAKLIVIDGLGDVVSIGWLNYFPFHVRSKIERRWERLMDRFYRNKYVANRREEHL